MIEKVERFRCGKCGYITESRTQLETIKNLKRCPACYDGKPTAWDNKEDKVK